MVDKNIKILVVDDQEANVRLLEQMLSDGGYTHISSTMNPHEVADLYRQNRYDLILLDLQMPGMDGFEVAEAGGVEGYGEDEGGEAVGGLPTYP